MQQSVTTSTQYKIIKSQDRVEAIQLKTREGQIPGLMEKALTKKYVIFPEILKCWEEFMTPPPHSSYLGVF